MEDQYKPPTTCHPAALVTTREGSYIPDKAVTLFKFDKYQNLYYLMTRMGHGYYCSIDEFHRYCARNGDGPMAIINLPITDKNQQP